MRALVAFGLNDLRSVRRDSLLLYLALIPWFAVLLARLLVPFATAWLAEQQAFDLRPYYPLLLSLFFVLQIPLLFGVVMGLLVLDERDDHTLLALQVTPVSMTTFALYRVGAATAVAAVYVVVCLLLSGLMPAELLPTAVPIAATGGLFGAVIALLLASLAGNKLEGLALMKAFGILMLVPLAAYFVESDWQLLLGVFPSYWPAKAFWVASGGGPAWPYVLVGAAYNLLLIVLLLRRFRDRLSR
jgi:fluoroquinolone transport system permease protein